jgi:hypothetical protein
MHGKTGWVCLCYSQCLEWFGSAAIALELEQGHMHRCERMMYWLLTEMLEQTVRVWGFGWWKGTSGMHAKAGWIV